MNLEMLTSKTYSTNSTEIEKILEAEREEELQRLEELFYKKSLDS